MFQARNRKRKNRLNTRRCLVEHLSSREMMAADGFDNLIAEALQEKAEQHVFAEESVKKDKAARSEDGQEPGIDSSQDTNVQESGQAITDGLESANEEELNNQIDDEPGGHRLRERSVGTQ